MIKACVNEIVNKHPIFNSGVKWRWKNINNVFLGADVFFDMVSESVELTWTKWLIHVYHNGWRGLSHVGPFQ